MGQNLPDAARASATPFLDLEKPLPKKSGTDLTPLQTIAILCGGIMLALAVPLMLASSELPLPLETLRHLSRILDKFLVRLQADPVAQVGYVVLVWYGLVTVHELGHVVAGRMAGLRFQWMSVGPIRFSHSRGKWTLERQKEHWGSGFAAMLPPADADVRARMFLFLSGGAIANIALFIVLLFVPYIWPAAIAGTAHSHANGIAWCSLLVGISALVPYRGPTLISDGSQLWMLVENAEPARRWMAVLKLTQAVADGTRFREWDPALVQAATAIRDGSADEIAGRSYAYTYESDRGNADAAAAHLDRLLEITAATRTLRNFFTLEAAFFQAWYRNDRSKATRWAHLGQKHVKHLAVVLQLRLEIGMLQVEGRSTEALQRIDDTLVHIRQEPESPARTRREQNWLEWKQELAERSTADRHSTARSTT